MSRKPSGQAASSISPCHGGLEGKPELIGDALWVKPVERGSGFWVGLALRDSNPQAMKKWCERYAVYRASRLNEGSRSPRSVRSAGEIRFSGAHWQGRAPAAVGGLVDATRQACVP